MTLTYLDIFGAWLETINQFSRIQKFLSLAILIESGYEDVSSDLVVHVELRKWADVALVAPCSANTLGKMALGLCAAQPSWGLNRKDGGQMARVGVRVEGFSETQWWQMFRRILGESTIVV